MNVAEADVGWSCDVVFPGSPTHHTVQVPAEEDEEVVVLPSRRRKAGVGNDEHDVDSDMEGLSDASNSEATADRDAAVAAAEAAAVAEAAAAEAAVAAAAKAAAAKAAASKAAEKAAEKAAAAAAKPSSSALPKKRPADSETSGRSSASSSNRDGDEHRITQRGRLEVPSSSSSSTSGPPSSTSATNSRAPPSLEAAPWSSSSSSHGSQQRAAVASQRPPPVPSSAHGRAAGGGDDSNSGSASRRLPAMAPWPPLPAMVPATGGGSGGADRPRKQSELMAETLAFLKSDFAKKWRPLLKELEVRCFATHFLRHTHTRLLRQNLPTPLIVKLGLLISPLTNSFLLQDADHFCIDLFVFAAISSVSRGGAWQCTGRHL